MLEINSINTYYGSIHALKDVTISVASGEITALLGANGAGKTTLLRTISGVVATKTGDITFEGQSIANMHTKKIVALGIAHVPEGRHVFPQMTVQENLEMGAYTNKRKTSVNEKLEEVYELFPKLFTRKTQQAGTLSGGEQQMVAMGRGLMLNPKLLLLDEPSMGLAPIIVEDIFNIIRLVNSRGTTVLLIEQNAKAALEITHNAYVIETGSIVLSGTGADLLDNPEVKTAYLGM